MAARARKAEPCKPSVHGLAPYGTKGPCPTCGRRRCHGKAKGTDGRCQLFPMKGGMVCRTHGGSARQVKDAAAEREAEAKAEKSAKRVFGAGTAIDHREAAVATLHRRYAMVSWYVAEVSAVGTVIGDRPSALLSLLDKAEKRLNEILRLCHDMRIDQQMLDLARAHADQTDRIIHALIRGLGHDPADPAVRKVVRGTLELVDGGLAS